MVGYVDAVEVALCFGWIDSTQKRIDDGKPVQHFTPRRKRSNWCWNNIEHCRRLIDLGEMTPAGLAVMPDCDPEKFVFEDYVVQALKEDPIVWRNFNSFPGAYRRIKVDRIQHYNSTKRPEYARHMLKSLDVVGLNHIITHILETLRTLERRKTKTPRTIGRGTWASSRAAQLSVKLAR